MLKKSKSFPNKLTKPPLKIKIGKRIVDIPTSLIIKILISLIFIYFLSQITGILITFFIAFILMTATKPIAVYLNEKAKVPEGVAITLVYLIALVLFFILVWFMGRPLISEITKFISNLPALSDSLIIWISDIPYIHDYVNLNDLRAAFNSLLSNFADQFSSIANSLVGIVVGTFSGVLQTFFVIIFSIYLFLEREEIKAFIVKFFNLNEKQFINTYDKIETQLGAWVRGQLALCFVVGFLTYILLTIFQIEFALPLAILAGILEIVPVIGPILTGVIMTLVGLTVSPTVGLICLAISILVQQVENNFLVPFVMRKAVGLSPVITITSLMIGQQLMGILGAIVSVPVAAVISVLVNVYLDNRKNTVDN